MKRTVLAHIRLDIFKPLVVERHNIKVDESLLDRCLSIVHPAKLFARGTVGKRPEHIRIGRLYTRIVNVLNNRIAAFEFTSALNIVMNEISLDILSSRRLVKTRYQHVTESVIAEKRLEGISFTRRNSLIYVKGLAIGITIHLMQIVHFDPSVLIRILRIIKFDLSALGRGKCYSHITRYRPLKINEVSFSRFSYINGIKDLDLTYWLTDYRTKGRRDLLGRSFDSVHPSRVVEAKLKPALIVFSHINELAAAKVAVGYVGEIPADSPAFV